MLKGIEKFNDYLEKGTIMLICLLMAAMIVIVFSQVVARYVFSTTYPWMEEMSRFIMIWLAFTGAAVMLRKGGHIAVTVVRNLLPFRIRQLMFLVDRLLITISLAVLIYYGAIISLRYLPRTPVTMDFPMTYVYMVFPLTFTLMFFFLIEDIVRVVFAPKKVDQLFRLVEDPELLISGELDKMEGLQLEGKED